MRKKYIVCMLVAALAMTNGACAFTNGGTKATAKDSSITVLYDGESVDFDVDPVNIDGTVLVPMRAVFEKFGAKVKWDGETQTVYARKGNKTYKMTLGENTITETKDDEEINSYEALESMQMVDDRTLIPLRAVGEILGKDVNWDQETKTVTIDSKSEEKDETWKENTGSIDLTALNVSGSGISVSDNVIKITEGGDFTVTGTNDNAQILIDTEDKVKLRLNGMSLTNTSGAAIYALNADKLYITLESGTNNVISDGGEYSEDAETNACLYSKSDLEIKGNGTLTVNGNVHNGISAKDDFEITNGTLTVTAVNDGIHVNDTAELAGGNVNITAGGDGIQSESILDITAGTINISCTGEVTVTNEFGGGPGGGMGGGRGDRGSFDPTSTAAPASTAAPVSTAKPVSTSSAEASDDDSEDTSSKGLKAGWMMEISGGTITVNSNDTCIKSDSELDIKGGTLTLTSEKKKGIKGMEDVTIDGGTIDIKKSTEGIESKRILTVNDGDISVIASDDGFNAGGGNTMTGGGPGGFGGNGGGQRPDMQNESGESSGNTDSRQTPEMPNGGMMGDAANGEQPPEMPNGGMMGDATNGGQPPEMPNGGMMGDAANGGQPPEMPNGDMTGDTTNGNGGDMSAMQPPEGGPGNSSSATVSSEHHIQINGGTIYINASGDGIDSNSSLIIDGGTVTIDGPVSGGDSALDHDGLFQINGGTVIAVGSAGMIENPADSSAQNVISAYVNAESGSTITIKSSSGDTVCSYKVNKNVGHIMFSSDDIKTGETYTVYADGTEAGSGTVEGALTKIGEYTNSSDSTDPGRGNGGGRGGRGGFGGNMQYPQNADTANTQQQ